MNFPSRAYFILFIDWSTENQLNILFVCTVADDNINYWHKFIMLNSKDDWILIYNFHALKSCSTKNLINEFPQKVWRLRSLNYLLKNCEKPAQQIDSRAVSELAHHILLRTLIQSMIWHSVRRVHQGHTKLPVRSPGKLAFCRGQWDASYTNTFSKSAWRNDFSLVVCLFAWCLRRHFQHK